MTKPLRRSAPSHRIDASSPGPPLDENSLGSLMLNDSEPPTLPAVLLEVGINTPPKPVATLETLKRISPASRVRAALASSDSEEGLDESASDRAETPSIQTRTIAPRSECSQKRHARSGETGVARGVVGEPEVEVERLRTELAMARARAEDAERALAALALEREAAEESRDALETELTRVLKQMRDDRAAARERELALAAQHSAECVTFISDIHQSLECRRMLEARVSELEEALRTQRAAAAAAAAGGGSQLSWCAERPEVGSRHAGAGAPRGAGGEDLVGCSPGWFSTCRRPANPCS
eukprot:tig00020904_g15216.t1